MNAVTETTLLTTDAANAAVSAEVASWDGVTVRRHSRGGIEFLLERRNLGHLHDGAPGGPPGRAVAHLPFPRRERDELIGSGRAHPHPVMPDSGWLGVRMATPEGVAETIDLFRRSYERALRARERRTR